MTLNTLFGTNVTAPQRLQLKQIKAVYEVLNVSEDVTGYLTTGTRYTAPQQVYEAFRFLMEETKEMFLCIHLDGKNRAICYDLVSIGSLNQSIVCPRSVFQTALLSNAAALICIHQHPSGDPTPSSEDIAITRRLKEAGEIINCKVLDHIVIGQDEYVSFVERGLL
jgi:DNA repair protein RadC